MRTRTAGALLLACWTALVLPGCMEDEMLAPEMLEDTEDLELYYPERGEAWERRSAEDAGFDAVRLEAAVDYAAANETSSPRDLGAYLSSRFAGQPGQKMLGPTKERGGTNGIVVREGYIVAEWGDTSRADMALGITANLLATLVGLAHDRELIPDLSQPVAVLVEDGGYSTPQNAPITWVQSLQQTSEWQGTLWDMPDTVDRREGADRAIQAPGTFWEQNEVRVNRLALSALSVWQEPLADILAREIMIPIGATRSWRWHGYRNSTVQIGDEEVESVAGGGRWGGGLWISTRDLARFGHLYLRRGMWRERRILSEEWVDAATAPSELNPSYGFLWWLNTDNAQWPGASAVSFAARGDGDSLVWIDPERDLVVVVRWIEPGTEEGLMQRLLDATRE